MTNYTMNETNYSWRMKQVRIKSTPEDIDIGQYKMEEPPEWPKQVD